MLLLLLLLLLLLFIIIIIIIKVTHPSQKSLMGGLQPANTCKGAQKIIVQRDQNKSKAGHALTLSNTQCSYSVCVENLSAM